MELYRLFWSGLTFVVLAWYSSITLYIAYRGAHDIRQMLAKLGRGDFDPTTEEP